jgi:small-conductance mechanosensitive channel
MLTNFSAPISRWVRIGTSWTLWSLRGPTITNIIIFIVILIIFSEEFLIFAHGACLKTWSWFGRICLKLCLRLLESVELLELVVLVMLKMCDSLVEYVEGIKDRRSSWRSFVVHLSDAVKHRMNKLPFLMLQLKILVNRVTCLIVNGLLTEVRMTILHSRIYHSRSC